MRHRRLFAALLLCLPLLAARADSLRADDPAVHAVATQPVHLSAPKAVALGLVEGVTEFLPVSSTGHLIITNSLMGLESEEALFADDGSPLYYKAPSPDHPGGVPLTVKLAADTYIVVIQLGAIAAVAALYWRQLVGMLQGLLGRNNDGLLLLRNLFFAVLPIATLGYLSADWIDQHLFSAQAVIVGLISGSVLMIYAERWRRERTTTCISSKSADELTALEALGIGLIQCLSLWPGTSRSMVTIVGGYFTGLSPARAAEFSFLVGLPVLGGAALLKSLRSGPAMIEVFGWDHVMLGIIVAAISGAIAIKSLVAILSRFGLTGFAVYRLLLAAALAWLFFA